MQNTSSQLDFATFEEKGALDIFIIHLTPDSLDCDYDFEMRQRKSIGARPQPLARTAKFRKHRKAPSPKRRRVLVLTAPRAVVGRSGSSQKYLRGWRAVGNARLRYGRLDDDEWRSVRSQKSPKIVLSCIVEKKDVIGINVTKSQAELA